MRQLNRSPPLASAIPNLQKKSGKEKQQLESKISAIHWKRPLSLLLVLCMLLSLCPYLTTNAEAASLSYKKCYVISQPYIYYGVELDGGTFDTKNGWSTCDFSIFTQGISAWEDRIVFMNAPGVDKPVPNSVIDTSKSEGITQVNDEVRLTSMPTDTTIQNVYRMLPTSKVSGTAVGRSSSDTYYVPAFSGHNADYMWYSDPSCTNYDSDELYYNSKTGVADVNWKYDFIAPIAVKTNFNNTLSVNLPTSNWNEVELNYVLPQNDSTSRYSALQHEQKETVQPVMSCTVPLHAKNFRI